MKIKLSFFIFLSAVLLAFPFITLAHQPVIIYNQTGDITINNPEISQAFYDELKGSPRNYYFEFPAQGGPASGWDFYLNLLVPEVENRDGRYNATVYSVKDGKENPVLTTQISSVAWSEYFEEFGRDYYFKGPEIDRKLSAGKYRIEVFSSDNKGKYVLAVGKTESFDWKSLLNIYWQLPLLKIQYFKSDPLQFFLTPFGIGGIVAIGALLILLAILYWIIGSIRQAIRQRQARTLLLTSGGMPYMKDEIKNLLQKPAYDITVGFITTAAKPEQDLEYLKNDYQIMKEEMGFNVEEVDIEGKNESQVTKALELKDIIFVEGGNTFYLLKAMRKCNFERVIRKLLKKGKVYIGVSAGSIVAGRTIRTSDWKQPEERFGVKNLKGLNLVPFDIFVHFTPERSEIIIKKLKWKWQRRKLRILTDEQAILVQGREVMLIGDGEKVII
jgi:peptidase E